MKEKLFTAASNATAPVVLSNEAITALFSAFGKASFGVVASNVTTAQVVVSFCAIAPAVMAMKERNRIDFFIFTCVFIFY